MAVGGHTAALYELGLCLWGEGSRAGLVQHRGWAVCAALLLLLLLRHVVGPTRCDDHTRLAQEQPTRALPACPASLSAPSSVSVLLLSFLLQVDDCGPMYLTVGDGGNLEGIYKDFVDGPADTPPPYCDDPLAFAHKLFPRKYQPQACFSYQDGKFCPRVQPEWSAYREPSFGYGSLELLSSTEAKWVWRKNQDHAWQVRGGGSGAVGSGHSVCSRCCRCC